jgi:hypothetical protein
MARQLFKLACLFIGVAGAHVMVVEFGLVPALIAAVMSLAGCIYGTLP